MSAAIADYYISLLAPAQIYDSDRHTDMVLSFDENSGLSALVFSQAKNHWTTSEPTKKPMSSFLCSENVPIGNHLDT